MNKLNTTRLTKLHKARFNVKDNRYGFREIWQKHYDNLFKKITIQKGGLH